MVKVYWNFKMSSMKHYPTYKQLCDSENTKSEFEDTSFDWSYFIMVQIIWKGIKLDGSGCGDDYSYNLDQNDVLLNINRNWCPSVGFLFYVIP
jgi:hypothetical protein